MMDCVDARTRAQLGWLTRVVLAALLVAGGLTPVGSSAVADPSLPTYLTVQKSVDVPTPDPGQVFTYTITVTCSEASCLDAQLLDQLPAQFEGFDIVSVQMSQPESSVPRTVQWSEGGTALASQPSVVGPETELSIDFTGATADPVGTGLENGKTFDVLLSLKAPDDLGPGTYVGTNVASVTATNAAPQSDSVDVTIEVAVDIDVATTKTWSPASGPFNPGAPSTVGLTATNESNLGIERLVIQEPATAPDGATALDPSNPFTIADFSGFGAVSLPAGADSVQVDAYVFNGTTWQWLPGTPSTMVTLPGGVDPADVGGLRFVFTASAPPSIAVGAAGSAQFTLAQRATHRNTGADMSVATQTVDNVTQATAQATGHDPATATAAASYRIDPATIAISASKDVEPERISAGDTATAYITGINASDLDADELRLSDLGYFTADVHFGGFTAAPVWPAGASTAEVVYHLLAGGTETVSFGSGTIPPPPSALISGFELVYTSAPGGSVAADGSTTATFVIETTEDAADGTNPLSTLNSVTASVEAVNGATASDSASDGLEIVKPAIEVTLDKTILPAGPVEPGDDVVTSLRTHTTTTSDYVTVDTIVIEDAWDGTPGHFWDGFDLTGIAATQVLDGASLTIEVQTAPGTWTTLVSGIDGPTVFSMTETEVAAVTPIDSITGVRFVFTDADGFPAATTVTPYLVSTARSTLRSGGSVTPGPDTPTVFQNQARVESSGETEAGSPLDDAEVDQSTATIVTGSGGPGVADLDKDWNQATAVAQSGQSRSTDIDWHVSQGFDTVVITDTADPEDGSNPSQTVFDAFDLRSIDPVEASATPFSNGWYMRYDTVTSIELYRGGVWETVPAPGGGWVNSTGRFVGYQLDPDQRVDTTGIRVTLTENTAARQAARVDGPAYDPYAPLVGSGVASSASDRTFRLNWTLRNKTRSDDTWVTATPVYNAGTPSIVENEARLTAFDGATDVTMTATDTIQIVDVDPGVDVTKTVTTQHDPTPVPYPGTEPAADYPTATYTITAKNLSTARTSYLRVMDPPACTDGAQATDCVGPVTADDAVADPFTAAIDWLNPAGSSANPFDRYDLTDVTIQASVADQVDMAASTAWLLHYDSDNGMYSTSTMSAAALDAADAAALADVVGISVAFQGTDPEVDGAMISSSNALTITMASRLRTHLRSSGEVQELRAGQSHTVTNRVVAQGYDLIVNPGEVTADVAQVPVVLSGGVINVGSTKSVTPTVITEPNRDDPVTVTLGANQGSSPRSTLSPAQVTVTDDVVSSPEFWDRFELTGMNTINAPAGADRVTIAAYGPFGPGGAMQWVDEGPTLIASATLPAVDLADAQGIRFTYSRDDGAFFSPILPAPNWSTSAQLTFDLRDTLRSTGEAIDFAADVIVDNTVTAKSDRLNGEASDDHSTTRQTTLTPGTQEVSVRKLTNNGIRLGSVGATYPFDLTFSNTGTGYLTIDELRDQLPPQLLYIGDPAPEFTPDPSGMLPGDVTVTADGSELVFTWPDDDRTMRPGETFTIRVWLELQPALPGATITNTFAVTSAQQLDSCSHLAGGVTTDDWTLDPFTCGASDYIQPAAGANLFTVKGVRGSEPGASVPADPTRVCDATLASGGENYFRAPCVANSVVNGVDHWVNRVQNVGSVPVTELTMFDQLPSPEDTFLISGTDRGSQYRPQIVPGSLAVSAPAGTTYTTQVTTTVAPCVGTWGDLTTQPVCEQNGEVWTVAGPATDWTQVTGFRLVFNFAATASGTLTSGDGIDVTYSTTNVVADAANPDGSFAEVPAADQVAWNQFGVKHRFGAGAYGKLAPSRVGVHLMTGPVQIDKTLTGAGTAYAADEFLIDVACDVEGVPLDMGAGATLGLNDANSYSARIDGVPVGADCTFTEQGPVGTFGESGRTGSPSTVSVDAPATVDGSVPSAQVAAITNTFDMSELSVVKVVDTDAVDTDLGPFSFSLSCVTSAGSDVMIDGATTVTFDLADGEQWDSPAGSIPVGSTCTLTETDTAQANETIISGVDVTQNLDGSAAIVVGADPAAVSVSNRYDSGEIVVAKVVDGPAAALYGAGPFGFTVVCAYGDQTVLDTTFDLVPGGESRFGPYPTGTECVVTEDGAVGAFGETTRTGTPATVTITEASAVDGTVPAAQVATVTNTFEATEVSVTKSVDTDAVDTEFGPYSFTLSCVTRIGQDVLFAADTDVSFSLEGEETWTSPVDSVPVGSTCTLTETDSDLADGVVIAGTGVTDAGDGAATIAVPDATAVAVTVTNHYDSGEIVVAKVVDGPAAALYGAGPFGFTVVCEYDGQTVLDTAFGLVDGEERRFGPYPTGTECAVTEDGDVGAFGETTRTGTPATVTITEASAVDGTVPAAQVATVTNTFEMTEVSVTKTVDTDAVDTEFGPYSFTLSCVTRIGQPVLIDGEADVAFQLSDGGTYTTPDESIPAASTCTLTETDADGADRVTITGDVVIDSGSTDDGAAWAQIAVGTDPALVGVVNGYDAGELVVAKLVDGPGAQLYGAGPFGFTAVCVYGDQTMLEVDFDLGAGESMAFGPYVAGTECVVDEVRSGGATTTVVDADGPVTVLADDPVVVTATNTFDVTSIEVVKEFTGTPQLDGLSFTVSLACTVDVDGVTTDVDIPGGATRRLVHPDVMTTTYDDLPTSATCQLTETDTADARDTIIEVDGESNGSGVTVDVTTPADGAEAPVEVAVLNVYDAADTAGRGAVSGDGGRLAWTGSTPGRLVLVGITAVIAGVALVFARRRRHA